MTVDGQLAIMVSWIDDLILLGPQHVVNVMKKDLSKAFVCEAEGPLKEFVCSKIALSRDANGLGTAKFTQPMLVQNLVDKYQVEADEKPPKTPANAGLVLVKDDGSWPLNEKAATEY